MSTVAILINTHNTTPPHIRLSDHDIMRTHASITIDSFSQSSASPARLQLRLDQAWFWSAEWQAKEREADNAVTSGDYDEFDSIDDFIADLEKRMTS
jgi:hypothetical protein